MKDYNSENTAIFDTKEQAAKESGTYVKAWIKVIHEQEKKNKEWLKSAKETDELYVNEAEKKQSFNILYSNTETIVPAVYNSLPLPDIRERFGESIEDTIQLPTGEVAHNPVSDIPTILERAVDYAMDEYDFDSVMEQVVLDTCLVGRGVPRVRYEADVDDGTEETGPSVRFQKVYCESVDYDRIVFGPARKWKNCPWIAFKHFMTRDQINTLNSSLAGKVKYDETDKGAFKQALVWEVWDKEKGEVLFIAETYKEDALDRGKPELNLKGFYPITKPVYAIKRNTTMCPTVPYKMYVEQAKELDLVTKRITSLIKCLKWRGVYAKGFEAFGDMESLSDGEFKPTSNDFEVMSGMGLEKAIMIMPIGELARIIGDLYQQREQIKQTIYEITGLSDIIRGATKAQETLGAQQLKAQWGSMRISKLQNDVQSCARELIEMMVEIVSENFEQHVIEAITNIPVGDEIMQVLRSDTLRRYKVDVETDSTIRADLSRQQQNISQFVQGMGSFIQSVGPAVQSGAIDQEVVVELLLSFSRNFKLGRQAEMALESLKSDKNEQQAQPDQGAQQAQDSMEMQLEKYKIDKDNATKLQIAQMDNQTKLQVEQMKLQETRIQNPMPALGVV